MYLIVAQRLIPFWPNFDRASTRLNLSLSMLQVSNLPSTFAANNCAVSPLTLHLQAADKRPRVKLPSRLSSESLRKAS